MQTGSTQKSTRIVFQITGVFRLAGYGLVKAYCIHASVVRMLQEFLYDNMLVCKTAYLYYIFYVKAFYVKYYNTYYTNNFDIKRMQLIINTVKISHMFYAMYTRPTCAKLERDMYELFTSVLLSKLHHTTCVVQIHTFVNMQDIF